MTNPAANPARDIPAGVARVAAGPDRRRRAIPLLTLTTLRRLLSLPLVALRARARSRRNAAELLELNEHMLRDVGLTRAEALQRAGQPAYSELGNLAFVSSTIRQQSRRP